jgi:hypothetical protein
MRRSVFQMTSSTVLVACLVALLVVPIQGSSARPSSISSKHSALAHSPFVRWMSGPAQRVMRYLAHHNRQSAAQSSAFPGQKAVGRSLTALGPNIRVNDPAGDGIGAPDMTTQSEASLAASGTHVVVGYNDDGNSSPFFEAGDDLTGYSWSANRGRTWQDARLPNPYPGINVGDPVVAADQAGHFYFANLDFNINKFGLEVSVARSDDGGMTFHRPTVVSVDTGFHFHADTFTEADADKPWLAVGPDPADPSHTILYASWTEFYFIGGRHYSRSGTRIMLSRSPDLGQTWSRPKAVVDERSRTRTKPRRFKFVQGSTVAVGPRGRVYVGWEKFFDRDRNGTLKNRSEWLKSSTNAGRTFGRRHFVGSPTAVGTINPLCGNVLRFGISRLVRVQEFPSVGVGPRGDVFMTYDAAKEGTARIRVARSSDYGHTWSRRYVSDSRAFMPSLSADKGGLDVIYYQRVGAHSLKTSVARSTDGFSYSNSDLSSTSFGVPYTLPPFDPNIAPCYMGDYNGIYRDRGTEYAAWGDNRDRVVNGYWPSGRLDPNVYFTRF